MDNIIYFIKQQIVDKIKKALQFTMETGELQHLEIPNITVAKSLRVNKRHGDYSSNIALQLAKVAHKPPKQIADIIISNMNIEHTYVSYIKCSESGFINFFLKKEWLLDALKLIDLRKSSYGNINIGRNSKIIIDVVTDSTTNPLSIDKARAYLIGDSLAAILSAANYDIHKGYNLNKSELLKQDVDKAIYLIESDCFDEGIDSKRDEVIQIKNVRLYGKDVSEGKIPLIDLIDYVGGDALRFYFNSKPPFKPLNFDLNLAVSQTKENKAFFVQYTYARVCGLLDKFKKQGYNIIDIKDASFSLITQPCEAELISLLAMLPEEIELSALNFDPSRLINYVIDVAALAHEFYNVSFMKLSKGESEQDDILNVRIIILNSIKIVIENVLKLFDIKAPKNI